MLRPFLPRSSAGPSALVVVVLPGSCSAAARSSDLLGAYSVVGEGGYDVGQVLRFWLWHVEELTLYVGVIPVVALVVLLFRRVAWRPRSRSISRRRSRSSPGRRSWSRRSPRGSLRPHPGPIPVLPRAAARRRTARLGRARRAAARRSPSAPRPCSRSALVTAFPYHRFIGEPAKSDTLALLPLWTVNGYLVGDSYWLTVLVCALALARPLRPRPGAAAPSRSRSSCSRCSSSSRSRSGRGRTECCAPGRARCSGHPRRRPGLDRPAVHGDGRSQSSGPAAPTASPSTRTSSSTARSGDVYYTVAPTPGGIGETQVTADPADGTFRTADRGDDRCTVRAARRLDQPGRRHRRARLAARDHALAPDGPALVHDDARRASTRTTRGPGPHVRWARRHCRGGRARRWGCTRDPNLVGDELTDVLADGRRPAGRADLGSGQRGGRRCACPSRRSDGTCVVDFRVTPDRGSPRTASTGSTDVRPLGAHFDAFVYHRPA